jgi:hypothetical protein
MKRILATLLMSLFIVPAVFATTGQKNLAVQDVDFNLIRVRGPNFKETVQMKITWQRDQFTSITQRNNSWIEARFYAGKKLHEAKRVMKKKAYKLQGAITSFTLSPRAVCSTPGTHYARVRFFVRHNGGNKRNEKYKAWENLNEGSFSYPCRGNDVRQLSAHSDFRLGDQNHDGYKDQVNLILQLNKGQLSRIQSERGSVLLELFAKRDNQSIRVKSKTYKVKSAKSSYSVSAKDFCGTMKTWYGADYWRKNVGASCRLSVRNSYGGYDYRYTGYQCPTEWFTCTK